MMTQPRASSSKAHPAIDSTKVVCLAVIACRCLDRMIQATHLIGDASPTPLPSTASSIVAAINAACVDYLHRLLPLVLTTCTTLPPTTMPVSSARCHRHHRPCQMTPSH
ncbi:hypothetical protein ACLOJK_037420 [Asimina triloba]